MQSRPPVSCFWGSFYVTNVYHVSKCETTYLFWKLIGITPMRFGGSCLQSANPLLQEGCLPCLVHKYPLEVMGTNQGGLQATGHENRLSKGAHGWPRAGFLPRSVFNAGCALSGSDSIALRRGQVQAYGKAPLVTSWTVKVEIPSPQEVCLLQVYHHGTEVQSWIESWGALPAPPDQRPTMASYSPCTPHPTQCLAHGTSISSVYTDGKKE